MKVIDGHEYCGHHSPGHPLPCGLSPGHDGRHIEDFASWCGEVRRDGKLYVCEYPKGHGGPCSYEATPSADPSGSGS